MWHLVVELPSASPVVETETAVVVIAKMIAVVAAITATPVCFAACCNLRVTPQTVVSSVLVFFSFTTIYLHFPITDTAD
jgi:hypothetical protein